MEDKDIQMFFDYHFNDMYPRVFNVSIDKVSLMGNWMYWKGLHPFQQLINADESPIDIHKGANTSEIEGYLFQKIWFKTNDRKRNKDIRDFKMEFNPKRLTEDENVYLKWSVLPLLRQCGFTRLDFAFDVEEDLSNYIFFDSKNPKKVGKYIGKNGQLESLYIGSRESEWHVCIYDKKKEKQKELKKEERYENEGKDYVADLTNWERKQLQIRKHWWRIEIRVKRSKSKEVLSEHEMFQSLHIIKPNFSTAKRVQDQAMIYFLTNFPEKIQHLESRSKKRAQQLLLNNSEFDLVNILKLVYAGHLHELDVQLKDYLSSTALYEGDIHKAYTNYEKHLIKNGEVIEVENLSFASKPVRPVLGKTHHHVVEKLTKKNEVKPVSSELPF
ncbi:replication initiation factor domain-containing protein [Domibacillus sp. PGB-M46]|uniref:replication initiation factor domain-containing protein n=1 Tax=Domibacillus sp. PGB-M46 TaxID=2910255 RepID=UPI001F5ABA95|nr:replication initiation factor domain-containing protein [Domibacillus sp. PGB-M46]MCI2253591.1 replication initiation factor domain-containing protein [Domibacillus sp. PGB-M46]